MGRTLIRVHVPDSWKHLATRVRSWAGRHRQPAVSPDRPRATQARILDGDTLWLVVLAAGPRGLLGLRSRTSGEVVLLDIDDRGEVGSGDRAGWADLLGHAGVIAADSEGHELVLVDPEGSKPPLPIPWSGLQPPSPIGAETTSDRKWRFDVALDDTVVVTARPVEAVPRVHAIGVVSDELVVRFAALTTPDFVSLAKNDGGRLTQLPVETEGDLYVVRVRDPDVTVEVGEVALVSVGREGRVEPLRRRHLDVKHPGAAVIMPRITGDRTLGRAALSVAYHANGQLLIRRHGSPEPGAILS